MATTVPMTPDCSTHNNDQTTCLSLGCQWVSPNCTDPNRMQMAQFAMDSVLNSFSSQMNFGLARFSDPNNHDGNGVCSAAYPDITASAAPNTYLAIESMLATTSAANSTPTAQSFIAIAKNSGSFGLPIPRDSATRPNYVVLCTDGAANCGYTYADVDTQLDLMRAGLSRTPACSTYTDETNCRAAACSWLVGTPSSCVNPTISTFVVGFQMAGGVLPNELNSNAVHGGKARTDLASGCPNFSGANCPAQATAAACASASPTLCVWTGTKCDYYADVTCTNYNNSAANCAAQPICNWQGNCSANATQSGCQAAGCNWSACTAMNGAANQASCQTAGDGCAWTPCASLNTFATCATSGANCHWTGSACTVQNGYASGGICTGAGGICPNQCGYHFCYYPASDPTSLLGALTKIFVGIASCDYQLTTVPTDSSRLAVYFGTTRIDPDPVNGWQYDASINTIHFYGSACDTIMGPPGVTPQIILGCPTHEG